MTEKPIGHCTLEVLAFLAHVIPSKDRIPIYTAPPKRPWVGLTDEEITELRLKTFDAVATNYESYRAIEAKLKERNT